MMRAALVAWGFWGFLELLGARAHVAVISGSVPAEPSTWALAALYTATFLAGVLVAPPAFLVGAFTFLHERFTRAERARATPSA